MTYDMRFMMMAVVTMMTTMAMMIMTYRTGENTKIHQKTMKKTMNVDSGGSPEEPIGGLLDRLGGSLGRLGRSFGNLKPS